jgi:hypothetical protein
MRYWSLLYNGVKLESYLFQPNKTEAVVFTKKTTLLFLRLSAGDSNQPLTEISWSPLRLQAHMAHTPQLNHSQAALKAQ